MSVPSDVVDAAETEWAPANDPVFQLVPPAFEQLISTAYQSIGQPVVTFYTFWDVYRSLHEAVLATDFSEDVEIEIETEHRMAEEERAAEEERVVKPPPPFADLPVRAGNFDWDQEDEPVVDSGSESEELIVEFSDVSDYESDDDLGL